MKAPGLHSDQQETGGSTVVSCRNQHEPQPDQDRHAGVELAAPLHHLDPRCDLVVLTLPRGGVAVAYKVAAALHAPLTIFLMRKLGVRGHRELAMGAIASGGVRVLDGDVIARTGSLTMRSTRQLKRCERAYRDVRTAVELRARVAILADDGVATGSITSGRAAAPSQIVGTSVLLMLRGEAPRSATGRSAIRKFGAAWTTRRQETVSG